jgi:exodeoxyribonuclease VII large subunit
MEAPVLAVSEFVALTNQTLEYSFGPSVHVQGELANFRVSKNKWLYFDIKDDEASVRCFGSVYVLPGPLEDGMLLEVVAAPRLHPRFGFSLNLRSLRPVGEGSIKQAAALLEKKLASEGLFDASRKRALAYPPARIGLVTSSESAAYADFQKVLAARWGGLEISLADVQVQGESAPAQIVRAIQYFNALAEPPEILALIRGGGSADDLVAFSDEAVVRAVAASRVPTLVAIGHEVDTSLAELAADQRASTPSNAAELLVPDRRDVLAQVKALASQLDDSVKRLLMSERQKLPASAQQLAQAIDHRLETSASYLSSTRQLLAALNPRLALARGFALVRTSDGTLVRGRQQLAKDAIVTIELSDASASAQIQEIYD